MMMMMMAAVVVMLITVITSGLLTRYLGESVPLVTKTIENESPFK